MAVVEEHHFSPTFIAFETDQFLFVDRAGRDDGLQRGHPELRPAGRRPSHRHRVRNGAERTQDQYLLAVLLHLRRCLAGLDFRSVAWVLFGHSSFHFRFPG